jgi:hypothetical protein
MLPNARMSIGVVSSLAAAFLLSACGDGVSQRSASDKSPAKKENLLANGQQGGQQSGQQGNASGKTLIKCDYKSANGMANCSSLDTVLVPAQKVHSKFSVRYDFACGEAGLVSPLGLASDQQYRAFIFGAKNTVSLFGKGPLSIRAKQADLDAAKSKGIDFTGCTLTIEVLDVQPVNTGSAPSPKAL